MTSLLYFDDLTKGMHFTSGTFTMSELDIITFAKQFDPQPFHTEPEIAKDTFFQGLVASGWHTASITMRLLTEALPLVGGLIGSKGDIHWQRPVRPSDTLHIEIIIDDLRTSTTDNKRGYINTTITTYNQNNEIVQAMHCTIIAQRR